MFKPSNSFQINSPEILENFMDFGLDFTGTLSQNGTAIANFKPDGTIFYNTNFNYITVFADFTHLWEIVAVSLVIYGPENIAVEKYHIVRTTEFDNILENSAAIFNLRKANVTKRK